MNSIQISARVSLEIRAVAWLVCLAEFEFHTPGTEMEISEGGDSA